MKKVLKVLISLLIVSAVIVVIYWYKNRIKVSIVDGNGNTEIVTLEKNKDITAEYLFKVFNTQIVNFVTELGYSAEEIDYSNSDCVYMNHTYTVYFKAGTGLFLITVDESLTEVQVEYVQELRE